MKKDDGISMVRTSTYVDGYVDTVTHKKPPLGLKPKFIHDEERRDEIKEAVYRMFNANHTVDVEWIREYNQIVVLKEREGV